MSRYLLSFDGFGHDSLSAEATLAGAGVAEVVRLAVRHYLSQLGSDRFALRVPPFAQSARKNAELRVGVDLDEPELEALVAEAERQGLAVELLIGHAALFYLADVDAGRAVSGA